MIKFRKASKAGVTARFIGGRFTLTLDGSTVPVEVPQQPHDETEIMAALEAILSRY